MCEVLAFTATGAAARDFKCRGQIRESSASVPSNISEEFRWFRPREFARVLEFARASLMKTQYRLIDGRDRRYLNGARHSHLSHLARVALTATMKLLRAKQRQAAAESR